MNSMAKKFEGYPVEDLTNDEYGYEEDDGTMPANVAELSEAVVGHRIVAVIPKAPRHERGYYRGDTTVLVLDDGSKVSLQNTDDCCAHTDLEDIILHLDKIDHIITGVGTTDGFTHWHIFADFGDVVELKVSWSCGNPFYYGYGFDILVTPYVETPSGAGE